jgi:hypothetical protein
MTVAPAIEIDIIKRRHEYNQSLKKISEDLNISTFAVNKVLQKDYLNTKDDEKLKRIMKTEGGNAFDVVENFFLALHSSMMELQYTTMLSSELREEISSLLENGGVKELLKEENLKTLEVWRKNSESILKFSANAPNMLKTYIEIYREVLEVQKEISFVRILMDALQQVAPSVSQKVYKMLDSDPAARAVMTKVSRKTVDDYFTGGNSIAGIIIDSEMREKEDLNE